VVLQFDLHPDAGQQIQHRANILNQGDILQNNRLICENTGCQHWEDGIFIAAGSIRPAQPFPAMYDESSHSY
jgi:hypothetical protein